MPKLERDSGRDSQPADLEVGGKRADSQVAPQSTDIRSVRSSLSHAIGSLAKRPERPWFCCWRRRPDFKQTFVILRHSERRDYVDPSYKTSEEGLVWPLDTPLTEKGVELAKETANGLLQMHQKAQFVTIACSPYRRCLETAAQVAKVLNLPIVIDQEIGEVRDRIFPPDRVAHRSPVELRALCKDLGVRIINPAAEDGGFKIFGKTPEWPESLDDAKTRYVVRMETYIRKSAEERQNTIIVTHADAVAAALVMFERGGADVQNMDFCARVVASRKVKEKCAQQKGVFAEQWVVEATGVGVEIQKECGRMGKYYEKLYLEKCDETQAQVARRKDKRTKTDVMFDIALKDLAKGTDEADEEETDHARV